MNPAALGLALSGGALAGLALPHAYTWLTTYPSAIAGMRTSEVAEGDTSASRRVSARSARTLVAVSELCGIGLSVASAGLAWLLRDAPGGLPLLAVWLVVMHTGVLLAAVDVAVRRLPTPVISAATLAISVVLAGQAATTGQARTLVAAALAAAALGGLYLALVIIAGSEMGLGDVRLAALLGAALGATSWPAVLLGGLLPFVLAAPEALARLALRRAHSIAFGPYLVAGALIAAVVDG
ncbi:prepilin peptidase [Micromonospora halophytica]|uniref:Leader peptidase (Prepilin peptidase) / N-methyltransferase n=1 Tax=Micromonospora halophytica TaxID=47864 RepID=A0A1C5IQ36_9ACTN|nr:prepilin peptidase [Micromonospora halophytica]SCG59896.1 leader peptidase (prepilin peptidase) / N-methyltransferase [Micromonospora halophytica]